MRRRIESRSIKESFDNLPSGVCFADSRGIIVLCNRQMHRLCHILLGTGLQHIFELREALQISRGGASFIKGEPGIFRFPDGEVWEFRESTVTDAGGKPYTQMQALPLTELYAKKSEAEQKNRELEEINKRAQRLYEKLDDIVQEEEAFAVKMRVHNDIGLRLLSTHKVFDAGSLPELREAGKMWKSTLRVLSAVDSVSYDDTGFGQKADDRTGDMLREVLASAAGIGVNVIIDGNFWGDEEQSYLLITAIMECATNTVRHARGNKMTVRLFQIKNTLAAWIENNGVQPKSEIVEGGGLSDLRRRIEKAGGTMQVQSRPKYRLTIILPKKEK